MKVSSTVAKLRKAPVEGRLSLLESLSTSSKTPRQAASELAIYAPRCIDTPLPGNQNTRLVFAEGYPSGQREQTVNLPAYAFEGSNPSPSTTRLGGVEARTERGSRSVGGCGASAGVVQW